MPAIDRRPLAIKDIDAHFDYLAMLGGLPVATRFLENANSCFSLLAENPQMGSPARLRRTRLRGLRKFPVKGFEYLIFYMPRLDGIVVVRVIHSSRDWKKAAR
jgi:toxin ParE1/3/4